MTATLREYIARFVHIYLDNIFIYSLTIEEHEEHLTRVFNKLGEAQLYLSKDKDNLYSEKMDCLGHLITNRGIYTDIDKMHKIHEWRQPWNYDEVQCFLGLVQYLAHFMPDVTAYITPLSQHM